MPNVTWVLESAVFPKTHPPLREAIARHGHRLIDWCDDWWTRGFPSRVPSENVVFHGSLGNAARLHEEMNWTPGSFCPVAEFHCSAWYERARPWLLHEHWRILSAVEFVESARRLSGHFAGAERLFVRPDSPLKPFSGRVVDLDGVSLKALDHGLYYDDDRIPVVVAGVRNIDEECRFVVVRNRVVAGSRYEANGRVAAAERPAPEVAEFAAAVARDMPAPAEAYILDVCQSDDALYVLELNPLGGGDLYGCDPDPIVQAVSELVAS